MLSLVLTGIGWLLAGVAIVAWHRAGVPWWRGLGLERGTGRRREFGVGVAIGTLAMGGIFAVEAALGLLHVAGLRPPEGSHLMWLALLLGWALVEEVLYRGLVLGGLLALTSRRWLAVVGMAALFGLAHAGNPHASPLSVISNGLGGAMYALAFLGTRRLWLAWGLHFAWNYVQGPLLGFPVSGLDLGGLLQQGPPAHPLLSGGAYGPEGGLVGISLRFVVMALVYRWVRRIPTQRLFADDSPNPAALANQPRGDVSPERPASTTQGLDGQEDRALE